MRSFACAGGLLVVWWMLADTGAAARVDPMDALAAGADIPGDRQPSGAEPAPCTAGDGRLPVNVRADRALRRPMTTMLRYSPTFREQCQRLADAPWVHVAVRIDPSLDEQQSYRAVSFIQRPQPNLMIAVVYIPAAEEPTAWVAHEFEHLLEQLEDVDLDVLSRHRRSVWRIGRDMFETMRAIRAGELVSAEVRAAMRRENKFVDE